MLELISLEIDCDLPEEKYLLLSECVSSEKRVRINRLSNRRKAIDVLMGEIIVRQAICTRTGIRNEDLRFSTNAYGKPYLTNDPNVQFNISHSAGLVICAINDKVVGVDIELIKPANLNIARRFFCDEEYEFVVNTDSVEAFYKIWTMKESYIKWDGRGLSIPLRSFNVLEIERRGSPIFRRVFVRPDACCHVCSDTVDIGCHSHYKLSEFSIVRCF